MGPVQEGKDSSLLHPQCRSLRFATVLRLAPVHARAQSEGTVPNRGAKPAARAVGRWLRTQIQI
jgi:hypothetical protein